MPYEWASWQTKGIQYVSDFLNANGDFLGHNGISEKFGVRCHFYTGFTNETKFATRVATGDTDRVLTQVCEGTFYSF